MESDSGRNRERKEERLRIVLDRVFAPSPRMYPLAEMQVRVAGEEEGSSLSVSEPADTLETEEDYKLLLKAYEDSLKRSGINEKIHHLDEVVIKARKRDKAHDVYQARTKSIAYYDVASEMDDIQDRDIYIGNDIHDLMMNMMFTPMNIDKIYGCVVLIETLPEEEVSVKGAKGVRKTWLEGYSKVKEFYLPDYRILPREGDYRRTLYWNPELMPDKEGRATIQFYNNSRCRRPRISVNVLDADGRIGVFEH